MNGNRGEALATPDPILEFVSEAIEQERAIRSDLLGNALRGVTDDFSSRGAIGHGRYVLTLETVAAKEIRARARLWIDTALGVLDRADVAWTGETAGMMSALLVEQLEADGAEATEAVERRSERHPRHGLREVAQALEWGRKHIAHEVRLASYAHDRSRVPVAEQLRAPRYSAVSRGRTKAWAFLEDASPDYGNAAKEAVSAVEELARIVVGRHKATLGDAIKTLRKHYRTPAPILKGIEEVWGWASNEPGVRHGSGDTVDGTLSRYIVRQADVVLAFLLELDGPERGGSAGADRMHDLPGGSPPPSEYS